MSQGPCAAVASDQHPDWIQTAVASLDGVCTGIHIALDYQLHSIKSFKVASLVASPLRNDDGIKCSIDISLSLCLWPEHLRPRGWVRNTTAAKKQIPLAR